MANSNPIANLASMSMRQLRDLAKKLGINRYSAQDRLGLAGAIAKRAELLPEQELAAEILASGEEGVTTFSTAMDDAAAADLAAIEAEMAPAPRPAAETRVVFRPRDPQWAYVFWEIAPDDREIGRAHV